MNQQNLFDPVPLKKLQTLSYDELIEFIELQQKVNETIIKDNERLRRSNEELKEKTLFVDEQYITIKNKLFGKSSEKEPSEKSKKKNKFKGKRSKKKKVQLPSERYPDAPLIEREVELKDLPSCKCCGTEMKDSGMTEDSEFLTVIPAQFIVIRQKRHKYKCTKCYGDLQTAPCPPSIKKGSSYSDEMVIDVAMSKYCDLIPIDRYSSIAGRAGLMDLPPQSLIQQTHYLADFIEGAYQEIKKEVLAGELLNADETTHRMLEGDEKSKWYLWGFSNVSANYFEIRDTRSGDVASEILKDSNCKYLMSDVFSGYGKAIKDSNKYREAKGLPPIKSIYCNAHARRKFKDAKKKPPKKGQNNLPDEAQYFIDIYKKIYRLEKIAQARPPDRILRARKYMLPLFEQMKLRAMELVGGYSTKSSLGIAMSYFLRNYTEFTIFVTNATLPIDNNSQERLMRNPVVGRKTWYGTHSKRGAKTAAVLFSIVESCRLNSINPREYLRCLVRDLHLGLAPYTPNKFKEESLSKSNESAESSGAIKESA